MSYVICQFLFHTGYKLSCQKPSLKEALNKKSTENMGDEVKQGNFLFHIDTKRKTKTSSKHISIFLIF